MQTRPSDLFMPGWSQDQLDSPSPPETEGAYFDHLLKAWVLSKHADILAALRASSLAPSGPHQRKTVEPSDAGVYGRKAGSVPSFDYRQH
jgi:hypothetical protein